MPDVHALLSASSSNRWLHCPPSALINAGDSKDTVFTREGTIAHSLAEAKVRHRVIGDMDDEAFRSVMGETEQALRQLETDYPDESLDGMNAADSATTFYADVIEEICNGFKAPFVTAEQRVDYSAWAPGGFGTSDCVIVGGDTLHVVDFKYGKGVAVSPVDNPQMKLYALGAMHDNMVFFDIKTVRMTIVQPRLSADAETWEITADELLKWADEVVKPAADKAAIGLGTLECGSWCKWCRNEAICRERARRYTVDLMWRVPTKADPQILTPDEIGEALRLADGLSEWYESLKGYALSACLNGIDIPGFKAVIGRSGARVWADEQKAFDTARSMGYDDSMLYIRKPLSLAQMEKLMGKKRFAEELSQLVEVPPGKPTLVVSADRRDAVTRRPTAADDFGSD